MSTMGIRGKQQSYMRPAAKLVVVGRVRCAVLNAVVQVNGKMRGTVEVAVGIDQAGAVAAAMELATVQKQTEVR